MIQKYSDEAEACFVFSLQTIKNTWREKEKSAVPWGNGDSAFHVEGK